MFVTEKIINSKLGKYASCKSVNLILLLIFFLSILLVGVVFGGKAIEAQISNIYNQSTDEIAGVSPLMSAVTENDVVGVRFFSKAGRSLVNQKNIGGATALHMACREKNFEIAQILVENGADVNVVDNEGWTPLMRAAMAGDAQIVDFLLTKGATAENINSVGESAVIHSVLSDCDMCVDAIFKRGNLIKRLTIEKLKEQLTNAFVIAKNHDNQLEQELLERYLDQAVKMAPLMQMQRQQSSLAEGKFVEIDESSDQYQQQNKMRQYIPAQNQPQYAVKEGYGAIDNGSQNLVNKRPEMAAQPLSKPVQYDQQPYYQPQYINSKNANIVAPRQSPVENNYKPKFKFVSGAPKNDVTAPSRNDRSQAYRKASTRQESFADMSKYMGVAPDNKVSNPQTTYSTGAIKYKLKSGSAAQEQGDVIMLTKKRKHHYRKKREDISNILEDKKVNFKLTKPYHN